MWHIGFVMKHWPYEPYKNRIALYSRKKKIVLWVLFKSIWSVENYSDVMETSRDMGINLKWKDRVGEWVVCEDERNENLIFSKCVCVIVICDCACMFLYTSKDQIYPQGE